MYLKTFLCYLFSSRYFVICDIFLQLNDLDHDKYYCLTNSSSPLSWIGDVNNSYSTEKQSTFIPNEESSYKLRNLEEKYKTAKTGGEWSLPVLDRRWEILETLQTYPETIKSAVELSGRTTFKVPFSVRSEKEVNIYLCDSENRTNCYKFMLNASNGTKTGVYKCQQNTTCHQLNEVNHTNEYLTPLKWYHFLIMKCWDKNLRLIQITENNSTALLDFLDDPNEINVTRVFIESKMASALWKFHRIKSSIKIKEKLERVLIGPPVPVVDNFVCISFFVLMHEDCMVKMTLKEAKTKKILEEKLFLGVKSSFYSSFQWKEIKFSVGNVNVSKVEFLMSTFCENPEKWFWAVDSPRLCQKNELRMITSRRRLPCQFVSKRKIQLEKNLGRPGKCSKDTFSKHCVPCSWISSLENCSNVEIFEEKKSLEWYLNINTEAFNVTSAERSTLKNSKLVATELNQQPSAFNFETPPKIFVSGKSIKIQIPKVKKEDDRKSTTVLYVLVTDSQRYESFDLLTNFQNLTDWTLAYSCNYTGENLDLTVDNTSKKDLYCSKFAYELGEQKCYNVSVVFTNTFANKTKVDQYSSNVCISSYAKFALALIVAIPVSLAIFLMTVCCIVSKILKKGEKSKSGYFSVKPLSEDKMDEVGEKINNPVEMSNFCDYVRNSLMSGELIQQHKTILQINGMYERILQNMVIDYVDIDFSDGFSVKKAYLVSKTPKLEEAENFWKLVWNENVQNIIFISENSEFYWKDNQSVQLGDMLVSFIFCKKFANHEERKFSLHYKNKMKIVFQFRYLWRDDLSSISFLPFFEKTSKLVTHTKSPILIHSSVGMEKIGFALLCDISIRQTERNQTADISKTCHTLCKCETSLVANTEYYLLAHLVLVEHFLQIDSRVDCGSFSTKMPLLFSNREIKNYFQYLKTTVWLDRKTVNFQMENEMKIESYSIKIYPSPSYKVDGYRCPEKFILREVDFDFWNFIQENSVSVVVSLNNIQTFFKTTQSNTDFIIDNKNVQNFKHYDWVRIELSPTINNENPRIVEIFLLKIWPVGEHHPENVTDFVNFCLETSKIISKSQLVLLSCCDRLQAAGLYAAMLYNMEQMQEEGICDVCTSVRLVRQQIPDFAINEKQFTFLWEAAEYYLKEVQLYVRK